MRDFRDAKAMAKTLRESLAARAIEVTHSESLELVARMFGLADWNTFAAQAQAAPTDSGQDAGRSVLYPAIPVRDIVPFPSMQLPLYVKREKTLRALDNAFANLREVVLVAQRAETLDEPGPADVYGVGVIARILDIGPSPEETLTLHPALADATQILTQPYRRVRIRRFTGAGGAYEAEIDELHEGPIPSSPDLIRMAIERFEHYAAARQIALPQLWPSLVNLHDPGRVADIIVLFTALPIAEKQSLLETINPVTRLEKLVASMGAE